LRAIFYLLIAILAGFCGPLAPEAAFDLESEISQNEIKFHFKTDKSVYLYADQIKFTHENAQIPLNLPPAKEYKNHKIFDENFTLNLDLPRENADKFEIDARFSACTFEGFCYEPAHFVFSYEKMGENYKISREKVKFGRSNSAAQNPKKAPENKFSQILGNSAFFWAILLFFGYGILMALTPCMFPMIPILSSILAYKITKDGQKSSAKSTFFTAAVYVLFMALTYAIIGLITAKFGLNLNRAFQIPAVCITISLFFVIFAANMFGLFEINLPANWQNRINSRLQAKSGVAVVAIMGILSALIVGPCIAAPLAGALIYIANSANLALGFFSLFALGLGMGIPLLIIAAGFALPKAGEWMSAVRLIFGFLMLLMAVWFSSWIIGKNLSLLLYGGILLAFSAFIFAKSSKFRVFLSLISAIYGAILLVGFFTNAQNPLKPLSNLTQTPKFENKIEKISNLAEIKSIIQTSQEPVIIDFWALWCANCVEVEELFESVDLSKFRLIQVDMTETTPEIQAILNEFSVFNPPSVLFFKNGQESSENRILGEISQTEFEQILEKITKK